LVVAKKELPQVRKDNQALARYINTKRKEETYKKEEEARKKTDEEAHKKAEEGQNSPRMSGLGESSHSKVVQGLSLLAAIFLLNDFDVVNIC
jgi:hypothetical protein